jgi:hypothetical protein
MGMSAAIAIVEATPAANSTESTTFFMFRPFCLTAPGEGELLLDRAG